jgi:hypothetical protein
MKIISSLNQLKKNLEIVEFYLTEGNVKEQQEICDYIRRGRSFVAYNINGELRFAPSRFCGYVNNTLKKHDLNDLKHGWDTNKAISEIIGTGPTSNEKLNKAYLKYCKELGLVSINFNKRRFWQIDIEEDFESNKSMIGEFPEGKIVERKHLVRERNSLVVKLAKANFKKRNGGVVNCEACGFNFKEKYGKLGENYIEAHHIIPVSEMGDNHITKETDFVFLCSNCHKMVHKKRPWLNHKTLKKIVKSNI